VSPSRLRRVTLPFRSPSVARVRSWLLTAWPSGPARRRCALDETVVLILTTWTYAGTGHATATPGAELAAASAARAREHYDQAAAH
jgi:hypothetical protein